MSRKLQIFGLGLGATAIILGAFAAHGLKNILSAEQISSFETGVRYQMYQAFFLLISSILPLSERQKAWILNLSVAGVIFFCGTVYALSTNDYTPFFNFKNVALLTPLGGLLLISVWTLTLIFIFRQKK